MYSPNNLPLFCVISQKYFYMSVKERLKEFIKYKNISERKFCLAAGLTVTYVNNIRVSIQPDKIKSIAVAFPELNTGWLLTGEGQMLKKDYQAEESAPLMLEETRETYQTINRLVAMNEKLFEENRALKEELDQLKRALDVQGKSA